MVESPLNAALRQFEAAEANLLKAERVLAELNAAIPEGVVFGENADHESNCRHFDILLNALPKIDGWKPVIALLELDEIAQYRLDANEVGEIECLVSVERQIGEPARLLREYRFRFDQMRRQLIRSSIVELVDAVDANLRAMVDLVADKGRWSKKIEHEEFEHLKQNIAEINTLLGSSVVRPARWTDLQRHMHFSLIGDLHDIIENDWPSVKGGLRKSMYGENEPVPVGVEDLGELASQKPRGPVATKLLWTTLTDEDFERLVFVLISSEPEYENPEWLTKTSAPDRGRDLSVHRVHDDPLGGKFRQRLIIQCKHWQTKSISLPDIAALREQIKLWEPPRIDICVIATSGRFTSDAVAYIERQNASDSALRIEMWPESHLELLLASRPAVIAGFGLR
jgi:hypothetical protein